MKWSAALSRGLLYSLIWWILSDGVMASWWIGAPAVLLTVLASMKLMPPVTFIWSEFAKFAVLFLVHSLRGGVDVAWRVFHPDMPIAPDLVDYPLRLSPGPSRIFMCNTVNLLPGTLSARLDANNLKVHVLDVRQDYRTELVIVEDSVARIFAADLRQPGRVA